MVASGTAPGALSLVRAYVNTVDLRRGFEELADQDRLGAWLVAHRLMEPAEPVTDADLKHAIAVREAIRGVIGANSGGRVYPVDVATLNQAAAASRLRARFGAEGRARVEPEAGGVAGAMGRVVAAVVTAMAESDWRRLKVCGDATCRRAFYDGSRNRSSRWCTMAKCGNRDKARRFRARSKSPSS
jgi:predicted RNA-binding Zn ribbon-like protein